jgi:hypothetical protein
MTTRSPVLFIVFNRPDTTRRVFEAIKAARPSRLYVAADGPRDRPGDLEKCAVVRRIATAVDWACDLKVLLSERNLGCKVAESRAMDWFFTNEPEGIILEDDVVPVPAFWRYCDELLERYREDPRVFAISGNNLIAKRFRPEHSYFFSRYPHGWGWAGWRRAWTHYDVAMGDWPRWRDEEGLARIAERDRRFEDFWRSIFDATHRGEVDTWDYQWFFTCWRAGGLTAIPGSNLTDNIGFGPDATHTAGRTPECVRECPPTTLAFPLRHPDSVERATRADRLFDKQEGIGPLGTLRR